MIRIELKKLANKFYISFIVTLLISEKIGRKCALALKKCAAWETGSQEHVCKIIDLFILLTISYRAQRSVVIFLTIRNV